MSQGKCCKLKPGLIPSHHRPDTIHCSIPPTLPSTRVLQAVLPTNFHHLLLLLLLPCCCRYCHCRLVRTYLRFHSSNLHFNHVPALSLFSSSFHPSPGHSLVALSIPVQSEFGSGVFLSPPFTIHRVSSSCAFIFQIPLLFPSHLSPSHTSLAALFPDAPANIRSSPLSFDWIFELYEPCRLPTAPATATPV